MTKCLVVDDVEVSRFTAKEFLSDLGMEVVVAADGPQALAELERSPVDVAFLDWHLGSASGLDVLKEIRAKFGSRVQVVVFSGVEGGENATQATNAGANRFLEKPTTKDKLRDCLKGLGISVDG